MKGLTAVTLAVIWVSGEAQKDGECPKEDPKDRTVLLPYPSNCTMFYKCNHGKPLPWNCPAGTHFNEKFSVCDWPHKAKCVAAPGEGVSPVCSRDKPGIFMYPHPEDCTKFYMCSNGLAFLKDCPPGTHFSEKLSVCDWPHKANCKQGPTSPPPTASESWKCPSKPPKDEPWKYMYPFPGNCRKFFMCSNSKAYEKDCPGGLYFNPKLCVCDWPQNSGCVQEPPAPSPVPDTEWKCPSNPPVKEPWRYMYPYPGDCTKFYMCSNGVAFVKVCPGGTYFNNKLSVCDWPDKSGCIQTQTTLLAGWRCPSPSREKPWRFMYPNPADCSKYYLCSHGVTFSKECPRGAGFNKDLQACDEPKDAGCARTSPSAVPAPDWPCPSRELHFYPHPEGPAKFYTCTNGEAYLRSCPEGLLFDDSQKACNLSGNDA